MIQICLERILSETKPHENPLIPHKKLRQLFVAMVEMRALDEHIAQLQRGVKARRRLDSTRGEEACRVSTAIELEPGDLVSDAQVGVAMEFLGGAKVGPLLQHVALLNSSAKKREAAGVVAAGQLPWFEGIGDRLRMAMGAALSFKALKRTNIVVAYVRNAEVSNALWRKVLALASRFELPIIFVVLPDELDKKKKRNGVALTTLARSCGVPGIPVDASDAVALYRVAQESLGRLRGDGGPVLVACIGSRTKGGRGGAAGDPLLQMREFLLGREVCSEAWLDRAGESLARQIAAASGKIESGHKA